MKRRIYFIISSILSILGSIYCILNSNSIVKTQIDSIKKAYESFPVDFQNRVVNILEKSGSIFINLSSILIIIFSLIILINSIKDNFASRRFTFIILSIISCFICELSVLQLLFFINFIVSLTIKGKKRIKKEIPKLEHKKSTRKEKIQAFILLLIYFSQFIWAKLLPDNKLILILVQIIFYGGLFVLSIIFFYNELKNSFKLFKNNFSAYSKYVIIRYLIGMSIFIFVNLITITLTKKATSINQETVESLPLWYILPLAIIWAPIVEEIIFRGSIRRLVNNKKLFIIISSLLFGVMHAVNEESIINIILTTMPYATFGAILSYIYSKTNNICTNIGVHGMQNTISSLLSIFIK